MAMCNILMCTSGQFWEAKYDNGQYEIKTEGPIAVLDVQNHRSRGLLIPILVAAETPPLEVLAVSTGDTSSQSIHCDTTLIA